MVHHVPAINEATHIIGNVRERCEATRMRDTKRIAYGKGRLAVQRAGS